VAVSFRIRVTFQQAQYVSWVNPIPAQLMLFESTKCTKLIVAADYEAWMPTAEAILAERDMQKVLLRSVDHWLDEGPARPYPFDAKLSDDPRRPFVVLHTSGSTGEYSTHTAPKYRY
jgi:acyl-coenzyme A synthetase/AMP-(fatty) acid ligase